MISWGTKVPDDRFRRVTSTRLASSVRAGGPAAAGTGVTGPWQWPLIEVSNFKSA